MESSGCGWPGFPPIEWVPGLLQRSGSAPLSRERRRRSLGSCNRLGALGAASVDQSDLEVSDLSAFDPIAIDAVDWSGKRG